MTSTSSKIVIATRGSALALAQAKMVKEQCKAAFPDLEFETRIIKTTGDKLQTASLASLELPKGLFTKELEGALLKGDADLAVHSLKDLPTDLPPGLKLGAVSRRIDVRDVLIYRAAMPGTREMRGYERGLRANDLPQGATVATSSNRRKAQLLEQRSDLNIVPIRGNVPTRLKKLSQQAELDAIILAAAGLERLHYAIDAEGRLSGEGLPAGLLAAKLQPEEMLPCVGQAAIGLEIREGDARVAGICEKLNDYATLQCVAAERAFLRAMGGGCQLAVAAYAEMTGDQLRLRAISFLSGQARRGEMSLPVAQAAELGQKLAALLSRNE